MRILIAGDVHGSLYWWRHLIDEAKVEGCDRILQLGDLAWAWPGRAVSDRTLLNWLEAKDMRVYFIDGNHDNHEDLALRTQQNQNASGMVPVEWSETPGDIFARMTYIPRGTIWEWDGVKFLGLGGAVSVDQERRIEGASWWRGEVISPGDVQRCFDSLEKDGPVDVMVSHDAPKMPINFPFPEDWPDYKLDASSKANRRTVRTIAAHACPKMLLHGHYHFPYRTNMILKATSGPYEYWTVDVMGLGRDGDPKNHTVFDTEKFRANR